MPTIKKTALITGCSSGFGRLAAKTFHTNGWNVVATMRSPQKETELTELDGVLVTRIDVTDTDSVKTAIGEALSAFGSIDVLVNNAGYGGNRLFEQASDEHIREMFETNVFGVMNVCRGVLPLMREQKHGTIINVSSMAGIFAPPLASVYASTKHAVEGLTQGMALDYKPLNIKVKSVLPGAYPSTRFNANTDDALDAGDDQLQEYARKLQAHVQVVIGQMASQGGSQSDPQEVADMIFRCATDETPIHNPVGADSQMLVGMMESMSRHAFLQEIEKMALPPAE